MSLREGGEGVGCAAPNGGSITGGVNGGAINDHGEPTSRHCILVVAAALAWLRE